VSYRLTMFTGKDVGPLSGAEGDMVPDRKGNQVRIVAQLLHRVCSKPFVFGRHIHRVYRVFATFFSVYCFRMVRLHDRQRCAKSRTTNGMVLALTFSHPEFEDHSAHSVEPHRKSTRYTRVVRRVYLGTAGGCRRTFDGKNPRRGLHA